MSKYFTKYTYGGNLRGEEVSHEDQNHLVVE
jgi:hypothetical protein